VPKITLYVPDGLVERVKALNPEVNVSQVFQGAMQAEAKRLTAEQEAGTKIRERVDIAAVRAKIRDGRAADYRAGYGYGLEMANHMDYGDWVAMQQIDWSPDAAWKALEEAGFELRDAYGEHYTDAEMRGVVAALRAVWDTASAAGNDDEDDEDQE
jgi:hypothetical protein